jgi:vacuolar-type H+-ATPase subunit B/Vma2
MTFHNISKITSDLIWLNPVKNISLDENVFILDGSKEINGQVVAITKTKVIIRPAQSYNFSNQAKVLFSGEISKISIPTNIFGRSFDGDFNPLDGEIRLESLNIRSLTPIRLNPLFLSKPEDIIYNRGHQILDGGFYELNNTQLESFIANVDTKNKAFIFANLTSTAIDRLPEFRDFDFGKPILLKAKNQSSQIINLPKIAFTIAQYLTTSLDISTVIVLQGFAKYLKTRIDENTMLTKHVPGFNTISEKQIKQELAQNFYLKNEHLGLTVIIN